MLALPSLLHPIGTTSAAWDQLSDEWIEPGTPSAGALAASPPTVQRPIAPPAESLHSTWRRSGTDLGLAESASSTPPVVMGSLVMKETPRSGSAFDSVVHHPYPAHGRAGLHSFGKRNTDLTGYPLPDADGVTPPPALAWQNGKFKDFFSPLKLQEIFIPLAPSPDRSASPTHPTAAAGGDATVNMDTADTVAAPCMLTAVAQAAHASESDRPHPDDVAAVRVASVPAAQNESRASVVSIVAPGMPFLQGAPAASEAADERSYSWSSTTTSVPVPHASNVAATLFDGMSSVGSEAQVGSMDGEHRNAARKKRNEKVSALLKRLWEATNLSQESPSVESPQLSPVAGEPPESAARDILQASVASSPAQPRPPPATTVVGELRNDRLHGSILTDDDVAIGESMSSFAPQKTVPIRCSVGVTTSPRAPVDKRTIETQTALRPPMHIATQTALSERTQVCCPEDIRSAISPYGELRLCQLHSPYNLVQKLDLSHLSITSLSNLDELPQLRHLILRHHKLDALDFTSGLDQLEVLDVSHGPLVLLNLALRRLHTLRVEHNQLHELDLTRVPNLHHVDADYNHIAVAHFAPKNRIESLALSHNALQSFRAALVPRLRALALEKNPLSTSKNRDLAGYVPTQLWPAPCLRSLNLADVASAEDLLNRKEMESVLRKLTTLDVRHARITSLRWLEAASRLTTLYATDNLLDDMSMVLPLARYVPRIRVLDLR
ncbi:hypothetical protein CXG81DRAFT_16910 [Caulochytrium protostelioides]|uniref:L domain-like protein n=1 Tax=Caulochytrium protostelioides TaxID=1555241 RepID=A0A4P9XDI3_9FUNG|nr:hypothetical protein CXG81DRAFT_16910 [Caulochytrium protostelioides]|eukprot:RKP03528.1 hypothetical protein CXG81DRAFT_16910 [Caulochytrium protostelioides]